MLRISQISKIRAFSLILLGFLPFISFSLFSPAEAGIIRDTEIEHTLRSISLPLAQQAGFEDGVHFTIVANPSYNAFIAGGDRVYIHSGLLLDAETDGEILGVIAHEIGHLSAGHVPRRDQAIASANLATAITTLAAIASTALGDSDAAAGIILGGTDRARRIYLSSSRQDEAVADEWALMAMDNAGFSAEGLRKLMRRLKGQSALPANRQSDYYTTHPQPEARLAAIEDHVSRSAVSDTPIPQSISEGFWRIRAKLSGYNNVPLTRALQRQIDDANVNERADIALALAYRDTIREFRRGALDEARQKVDVLVNTHPDDAFFHELSGDIAFAAGNPTQAADAYRTALSLIPDAPQIALSLGRVLIASGDASNFGEAVEMLEQAVQGEPEWPFARRELGIAYGRNNQLANAHLSLAEEALLRRDNAQAIRMSERVLRAAIIPDDVAARARDILFELGRPVQ